MKVYMIKLSGVSWASGLIDIVDECTLCDDTEGLNITAQEVGMDEAGIWLDKEEANDFVEEFGGELISFTCINDNTVEDVTSRIRAEANVESIIEKALSAQGDFQENLKRELIPVFQKYNM